MSVELVDVELADSTRIEHHVLRVGTAAGCVVRRDGMYLLMRRHRFITDTIGWEIPAGRVDQGERPRDAAVRECIEETGWEPLEVDTEPLVRFYPTNGISDQMFVIYQSQGARYLGPPTDSNEQSPMEWLSAQQVRAALLAGDVTDGLSVTALSVSLLAAG